MVYIYILQLENDKYYIGKTTNPEFRIIDHFNSNGSTWTQKYKPIKLIEIIPNCSNFDEDKFTLEYMNKYGIDNVRGGSFCEIILNNNNKETINRMIMGATDTCYKCGELGHFIKECVNDNQEKTIYNEINYTKNGIQKDKIKCGKCNRTTHETSKCYAKTYDNGNIITNDIIIYYCKFCNKQFNTLKGVRCHENIYCKQNIVYACNYCDKEFNNLNDATYHENKCSNNITINKKIDECIIS